MKYLDDRHREDYEKFLLKSGKQGDPYHEALFYLLALSDSTARNVNSLYDFDCKEIRHEGLNEGFQTGTSVKVTRLAFNLFNGYNGESYNEDKGDWEQSDDPKKYTPYELFCTTYQPFMLEAVKIRYPEYAKGD